MNKDKLTKIGVAGLWGVTAIASIGMTVLAVKDIQPKEFAKMVVNTSADKVEPVMEAVKEVVEEEL